MTASSSLWVFISALIILSTTVNCTCCVPYESSKKQECAALKTPTDCVKEDNVEICYWHVNCQLEETGKIKITYTDEDAELPDPVLAKEELSAAVIKKLNTLKPGSEFFGKRKLTFFNNKDKEVRTFKFREAYLKALGTDEAPIMLVFDRIEKKQDTAFKQVEKAIQGFEKEKKPFDRNELISNAFLKVPMMQKGSTHNLFDEKIINQLVVRDVGQQVRTKRRLLQSMNDSDYTYLNNSYRRLAAGGAAAANQLVAGKAPGEVVSGPDNVGDPKKPRTGKLPYKSVGLLTFKQWVTQGVQQGWAHTVGTGTVIESRKEGGVRYDYVFTAAHNVRKPGNQYGNRKDFSKNIAFHIGLNHAGTTQDIWPKFGAAYETPSHKLEPNDDTVLDGWWAAEYVFPNPEDHAHDYAIIKFKSPNQERPTPCSYKTTKQVHYKQMRLITYRVNYPYHADDYLQHYVPTVIPDAKATNNDKTYLITPYYTKVGMSGSGLFLEKKNADHLGDRSKDRVTNVVVAAHVGKVQGVDKAIHTRLTRDKIHEIDRLIIAQNWFDIDAEWINHVLFPVARTEYRNSYLQNDYANKQLYNQYEESNVMPNYYEQDHRAIAGLENEMDAFILTSLVGLTVLLLIGIIALGLCVCGVMFGFVLLGRITQYLSKFYSNNN